MWLNLTGDRIERFDGSVQQQLHAIFGRHTFTGGASAISTAYGSLVSRAIDAVAGTRIIGIGQFNVNGPTGEFVSTRMVLDVTAGQQELIFDMETGKTKIITLVDFFETVAGAHTLDFQAKISSTTGTVSKKSLITIAF